VPSWPDAARRLVSVVIFLTSSREIDPDGTCDGGALTLHDDQGHVVTRLVPAAVTLVAFPSGTPHEVAPITAGVRETIVDWFYDAT
jgi:predicted 2-oxoglutarate/Fe(II)-dependent dioxygenase YbiX